ncbi:type II secretion system major pseudopilin GspG [Sphingomonas sp. M1-B02]|uniref:type II secretion system major pseudopilin GspG n=1 Tax=Sphingomonas sp. M1-B02 TaxID=3114300 RepID=UPI002240787E|nr:type II secretion system major pseudopilin GspG [Sphingomonas sp. S6-11]UZK67469.1 type II secretion system major pseudopilin GspG [Sphingomonas sp. S6-11]
MKQFSDIAPQGSTSKRRPVPENEAGLTLVEMIVVLAIIALVAALIVPNVIGRPDQARVTTAGTDIATIASQLTTYRLDNGAFPTTEQGLKALVEKTAVPPLPATFPDGGYISTMPQDPWGKPYVYESNGTTYEIKSLGRDGKPGGEGVDADIARKR